MKRNAIILLILFSTSVLSARSQSFYEVTWSSNSINYYGFLIFYSDNDATMRVKYNDQNGQYKVAEYKCTGSQSETSDHIKYYLLDGEDARVVYGSANYGYSADKFMFYNINSSHQFEKLYTYDGNDVKSGDLSSHLKEANWRKMEPSELTPTYVYNYFNKDEQYYTILTGLGKPQPKYDNPNNVTLHLIIMANTRDNSIGRGCEIDRRNLKIEFENIASALNIPIDEKIFCEDQFTKDNLLTAINNLNPGANDIVVFFYRGHGFRWNNQTSSWPQMALTYSHYQPIESNNYPIEYVYSDIVKKGARLNIVVGDLCNSNIGIDNPEISNQNGNAFQSDFVPDMQKLHRMFMDASGSILATSAQPSEVSWVNAYDGGLYTSSFVESLHKEVSAMSNSGNGDWLDLITTTISRALYKSTTGCSTCTAQHGIYYTKLN
jgi:hypothetical protein